MYVIYRSRILLLTLLTGLVASAAKPHNDQTLRLPNVVIIFVDDMGYSDIGPFGAERATPQLDCMAKEGMKLTDFYVSCSACTPSRAALLTGAYADRVGMGKSVVFPADTRGLNPSEITIAEILKQGGYATGCFGKWHLGDQPEFIPLAQGFDVYEGIPYSNDMWVKGNPKHNFPPLPWIKQDKAVAHIPDHDSQARITDCITDATVDFIRANKDRPFFAYVPHAAVHAPHMVTPERLAAAKDDVMTALVTEIDSSTGRILDTLRELGIAGKTLVIFTNDNGGAGKTSSGPLRGAKFGPKYEGHMRVSTLAWWPGKIPAGSVSSEIGATIDLLPTIASFAGQPIPSGRIDGYDIGDILLGKPGAKSPHDTLYFENDGIRQGKWKLVRYRIKADCFTELYDLQADLGETTNLADMHPDRVKAMTALLDAHVADIAAHVRPAAFVDNPKPLLASAGDLPTLAQWKAEGRRLKAEISPLVSPSPFSARGETLISTFEDGIGAWTKTGSAFDDGPRRNRIAGFLGEGYINSYVNGDKALGTLTSPPFKVERTHIKFLIGGGKHPGKTGLTLLVGDAVVRSATGNSRKNKKNEEVLDWKSWDVSEYIGESARLRIIDQHSAGWGHTVVDHIVQADRGVAPPGKAEGGRLKAESGSPSTSNPGDEWDTFGGYAKVGYDQALRPQFHFSSRMGWLNDPNGMVYYDGEWHMLFQHYAKGNASGAKSWGNAVSTDLMHWQQLPHAINPYPKVDGSDGLHAIWSGSAVVDIHNALGKQKGDTKTLFALYSATHEKFFQGGAYSTDKGRTWTKINDGKPVIPHQEGFSKGQRDPRIFYYAPGKFYLTIMMIGGPERAVRLWKSTHLLDWKIIGDIPNKAAECIDMYQIGDKWGIADANTRYEVGDFDGETWTGHGAEGQAGNRLKFDYGDAYYAAQAFNQG
ncbi:MAG: arylsulfatase A, partial [Rhodothermales bacterium]